MSFRRLRMLLRYPSRCMLRMLVIFVMAVVVVINIPSLISLPLAERDLPRKVLISANAHGPLGGLPLQPHIAQESLILRPEAPMRQLHAEAQLRMAPRKQDVVVDSATPDRSRKQEPQRPHPVQVPGEVLFPRLQSSGSLRSAPVGKTKVTAAPEGTDHTDEPRENSQNKLPCAWVPYTKTEDPVHYIIVVLKRFGYVVRYRHEGFKDCALIWTFEYPFWRHCWSQEMFRYATTSLRKDQKVNHFPGIGYVANKASMARFGCTACPTSFILPDDANLFLETARRNVNWTWVVKNQWHRGVRVVKPNEVNLKGEQTFIQRFISDPLLIDGRKFDFSVFVALTSINPLRVYMYDSDWAARFCSKPYHPFDPADTKKYVVYGTDHMPLWEVESLKNYWNLGYGFKKSLFIYLKNKGYDTDKLEKSVQEAIRQTFVEKEKNFINAIRDDFFAQNDTRNLFELVRFDFLIDQQLNLYVMEVNMSPNLSTEPGNPREQLYKTMLHDLLSLVGVNKVIRGRSDKSSDADNDLYSSPRDLLVFSQECFTQKCMDNCLNEVCHMCSMCLRKDTKAYLLPAFVEHLNRHGFRRLVPAYFKSPQEAREWNLQKDKGFQSLSAKNKIMFTWFRGKCAQDATWCN